MELTPIQFDEPDRSGPKYFIGERCCYFAHNPKAMVAWITFRIDNDDGVLEVELDCDYPHPDHWLAYWIDHNGLNEVINSGLNETQPFLLWFLLDNGIAPGQPFLAEVRFWASTDYWGEYDEEIEVRVMDVEPWPVKDVEREWRRYLIERRDEE